VATPFSISCKKAPERKTDYTEGTAAPTGGEAIEIRVEEEFFHDKLDFWSTLEKLLQRLRERNEPRF
jgi:hypothetical protein